jgi:DNA-directed RNA polymerase specialized sigma24 family protein
VKVVTMMHDGTRSTTFDAFFLVEFLRLVSMLTAWSGDRSVAEDLAQDALVQAHRNWSTVNELVIPTADVLGCSDGTVKTHLQRARRTLASHLSIDAGAQR